MHRPGIWAPRAEKIGHQAAVVRVPDLVHVHEVEEYRSVLGNCIVQIEGRILVEPLHRWLPEVEVVAVALQGGAGPWESQKTNFRG